jgi:hypothetical protein
MRLERPGLRCLFVAALAATGSVALAQPALAQSSAVPRTWTFEKCQVAPGVWQGKATAPDGTAEPLETRLTGLRQTDAVLHVEFDWYVGDTYLAKLSGTLDTATGAVIMNGRVAEGLYEGSRVHEEGQLTDAANSCFSGTIRVMPESGSLRMG